jgi:hypothetical protein
MFRYKLRTLLIAIAWAGLISLGLRSPTALMAGIVSTMTLVSVLLAVLMTTYCVGTSRAMAIGYLVFCVGYLVHLVIDNWISGGEMTPWGTVFIQLYILIHGRGPTPSPMNTGGLNAFSFTRIGHNALSCILGLAGAFIAQVLYRKHRNGSNVPPS